MFSQRGAEGTSIIGQDRQLKSMFLMVAGVEPEGTGRSPNAERGSVH